MTTWAGNLGSPWEAESSFVGKKRLGFWLKPSFEKHAEAGSGPHVWRLSGPKGPVYYASRQPAEAGSWQGPEVPIQRRRGAGSFEKENWHSKPGLETLARSTPNPL